MYCRKCGTKLNDNAKFCKNCGEPVINKEIIKEPETPKIENAEAPKAKKRGWFSKFIRFIFKMIFWLILLLVLIAIIVLALDKFNIVDFDKYFVDSNIPKEVVLRGEVLDDVDYEIEESDADSFFENHASVIDKIEITKSDSVQNEKTISDVLTERNFDAKEITSHYSMNGEYYDDEVIDDDSEIEHPTYQLLYVNSSNELWTISIINGSVMASPISYNMQASEAKQYVVSETEYITSYDALTNTFYVTIPDETVLNVYKVNRIDTDLLDSLTIEVINSL